MEEHHKGLCANGPGGYFERDRRKKETILTDQFDRKRGFVTEEFFKHFNRKLIENYIPVEHRKPAEIDDTLAFETLD